MPSVSVSLVMPGTAGHDRHMDPARRDTTEVLGIIYLGIPDYQSRSANYKVQDDRNHCKPPKPSWFEWRRLSVPGAAQCGCISTGMVRNRWWKNSCAGSPSCGPQAAGSRGREENSRRMEPGTSAAPPGAEPRCLQLPLSALLPCCQHESFHSKAGHTLVSLQL